MSYIEKLSIQGIRSFGAKAEDAQQISFISPVTLILGENGCGKTTIIECLKYALTGECPPGSDRGKSFVHDPKIFSMVDSLGQIKLQVRNVLGERLSVCRSMRISYRRNKFTFETLDSTVNYLGKDEDPMTSNSISKRVADVDLAMSEFMGVSKAIINNVLFCHQEDSSWPLDEPKKLKEKFDAIFGIVEHNKAIEKLIKVRKEKMEELKVLDANLQFLEHLKQEMEDKTLCLQKAQQKCSSIKNECTRCEEDIKPIEERMQAILKIETEMGKYQALKVQLETQQKNCNDQIVSLSKKITNIFEGDLEGIDSELLAFEERMSAKQEKQTELQEEIQKLKVQAQTLLKKQTEYDKKRCLLVQQRQSEQELNSKRAEQLQTLATQLNLPVNEDLEMLTQPRIDDILLDIQNALENEEIQIIESTALHDDEDQKRQAEIDNMRIELTKLEEHITTLQKQATTQKDESDGLDKTIIEIEKSTGRLKLLTNEIKRLEETYEDALKSLKQDERRKEIANSKADIVKLQAQYKKLDERLTFLGSIAKSMAEINLKKHELEKKEQEVRRVKSKQGENLRKIFVGRSIELNFRRNIQTARERLQQEIKDLNEREQTARLKAQSFEIKRKNVKDDLVRLEKELEESREKVFQKCHDVAYEDLLDKCKAAVNKYQIEHSALCSAESMYKRYLQKIEEEPCCPLCHKSMSHDETADLTTELNDEIHQLPANKARSERLLKAETKKYESLLQLRPVIERVAHLEQEIPKRKDELKNIQIELADCTNENEKLKNALNEPNQFFELANSMLGDMTLLDEALKEIARLSEHIDKLKRKLPAGADADDNMEDLQIEKSTIAAELEDKRKNVEEMQQEMEKQTEILNQIREKKNTLKDEHIKLQEGVQSLPELKKRQNELIHLLAKTGNDFRIAKAKVQPLKNELNQSLNEKTRLKEINRKKITEMQKKMEVHRSLDQDIQRLNKEVTQLQALNLQAEVSKLKELLVKYKSDIEQNDARLNKKIMEFDLLKTECLKQESIKRELKDNRELKLLQQNQKELNEKYQSLSKQVGDLDYRKALREKNSLIAKRDQITVRKSELLGQMGEINNQISKLAKEIEEPKYKESLINFRRAHCKVQIKKALIADLGRYRLALEWALIQFHAEKMKRINSLIREYWRLIYRGNDIDYVEIKTDAPNSENATADKRRSYNYRVIQSKNDTEIEMRGRCSAGQRVLASLIIRMALAETFSSNCGVLALDEPTTNLDRQNILSLCDALNRIVEERQFQTNFMLIIITHDEDFIMQLGKIESYHRVFRNSDCKSVIRKVKVA